MNEPSKILTVTEHSQNVYTAKIDDVIKRINECILTAASNHQTSVLYSWFDYSDWEGTRRYYSIPLPDDAVEYVLGLFIKAGYRITWTQRWWQFCKRYTFHWDYAKPLVLNHTVEPIDIPDENIKKNTLTITNHMG